MKVHKHLLFCACVSTHIHAQHHTQLLLSLFIIELTYCEEVCLQRLEILVCPQAFDQQGKQRKEKYNRVKSKRTEGKTVYYFLSPQCDLSQ